MKYIQEISQLQYKIKDNSHEINQLNQSLMQLRKRSYPSFNVKKKKKKFIVPFMVV